MSVTGQTGTIGARLRGAAMRLSRLAPATRRPGGTLLPRLAEIALVILFAFLLSRLIFGAVPGGAPAFGGAASGPAQAAPPADLSVFSRFDPFAARPLGADASEMVEAQETNLDITLSGIWPDEAGTGIAIIKTGSRSPRMYTVGEEIMDGVTLDRVYPYHVIILRGGRRESVYLARRERPAGNASGSPAAGISSVGSAGSGANTAPAGDVGAIGRIVTVRPVLEGSDVVGYRLFPRDETLFARTGLVAGDYIMSVNGRRAPVEPDAIAAMLSSLDGDRVELVVDRDGVATNVTIDFSELL